MPIVKSSYVVDKTPQADGRSWVKETHIDHLGKTYTASYLADKEFDYETCMRLRSEQMSIDVDKAVAIATEAGIKPITQEDKMDTIISKLDEILAALKVG